MTIKKYKNYLCIVNLILVMVHPVAVAQTAVIRFASAIYPPFTILNAQKELQGFDIDLAKTLCEKTKTKCTFSQDNFSNMVSSLTSKKYDAWINAISITDERQKEIVFSNPYFSTTALLIANKDSTFSSTPREIKNKIIGVGKHTCYINYLKTTYGDRIKIKIFSTRDEAHAALDQGLVDAVIDDATVLRYWRASQNTGKKHRLINLPAKYSNLAWHKYGIAVKKDNTALVAKLNSALASIKADGTYDNLRKKYFANE